MKRFKFDLIDQFRQLKRGINNQGSVMPIRRSRTKKDEMKDDLDFAIELAVPEYIIDELQPMSRKGNAAQ